jgi:hypothetical protein
LTAATQARLARSARLIRRALRIPLVGQLGTTSCHGGRSSGGRPQAATECLGASEHQSAQQNR